MPVMSRGMVRACDVTHLRAAPLPWSHRSYARRMTTSVTSGTGATDPPGRPGPTDTALRPALKRAGDGAALDDSAAGLLLQARGPARDALPASPPRVRDAGL